MAGVKTAACFLTGYVKQTNQSSSKAVAYFMAERTKRAAYELPYVKTVAYFAAAKISHIT